MPAWVWYEMFQILIGILKAQIRALDSTDVPKFQILIGILKALYLKMDAVTKFVFQILIGILKASYQENQMNHPEGVSNPYRYSKSEH